MVFWEWIGAVSGLLGVWFTMRKNIWCFPVGLVNVAISSYLFFEARLLADTLQQIVFGLLILFGWIAWSKNPTTDTSIVSRLNPQQRWYGLLIACITGVALGMLLGQYTDAHFPYIDSMLTAFCFWAQYLIAQKKIENWLIWMATNTGYVVLYLYKDLHVYAGLYVLYFALAIWGYRQWKTQLNSHG